MNFMKTNNNMFFFFLLINSSIMILLSNLWMNMWIFFEINLLSFIFLMINKKNYLHYEASLIYFLIQTLASILLLMSMVFLFINKNMMIIIIFSLFLKMGMAPLHFWIIVIIEKLIWEMNYLLLTWQKIAPLTLYYQFNNNKFIMFFSMFSMFIGSIMGLNYSSLKKIMAFSSINQLSWMIISLFMFMKLSKLYYFFYMYMMLVTIFSFKIFNLKYIYQFISLKNNFTNMMIFMNLLSLGSLPPFMGFFPKLMIINLLNNSIFLLLMILFTLITLYYYIRIMLCTIMLNSLKLNMTTYNYSKKINLFSKLNLINNLFMLILLLMY